MTLKFAFLVVLALIFCPIILGQSGTLPINRIIEQEIDTLLKQIDQQVDINHLIINGTDYKPLNSSKLSHPYLITAHWTPGEVSTKVKTFENQRILYDIEQDKLIINHLSSSGNHAIALNPDIIAFFKIGEKHFVNISNHPAKEQLQNSGFYEAYFFEKATLLVKHRKKFVKSANLAESYFDSISEYYLYLDSKTYPLRSKNKLIKLLGSHKVEFKKVLQQNRTASKHQQYIQILEHHDSL